MILILFTVALLLPVTQTFLGHRMTSNLYARFGTTLNVDHIRISPFGYVILNDVTALDHKQDTLIHIGFARMNALRLQKAVISLKNDRETAKYALLFDNEKSNFSISRFIPASGMASRMFKFLHFFLKRYDNEKETLRSI